MTENKSNNRGQSQSSIWQVFAAIGGFLILIGLGYIAMLYIPDWLSGLHSIAKNPKANQRPILTPPIQSSTLSVPPWEAPMPNTKLPPGFIPAAEAQPPKPEPSMPAQNQHIQSFDPRTHRPPKNPGRTTSAGAPGPSSGQPIP